MFTALPIAVLAGRPSEIDADLLIVPVHESDDLADLPGLDAASGGEIGRALASGEFKAAAGDLLGVSFGVHGYRTRRALCVGAGPRARFGGDEARRLGAAAAMAARQRRASRVAVAWRGNQEGARAAHLAQALAEGLTIGQLETATFKTEPPAAPAIERLQIVVEAGGRAPGALDEAVARGRVLGECTNHARELGNEPANVLSPRVFAERALALSAGTSLQADVLDEDRIAELNMGLLLGVSRGSAEPPRVIVLRHEPEGAPAAPVLGLVGKGITFDSGGISIKPAEGMERMKDDMAGGAAVVSALRAASLLNVPLRVVGVVPASENMPGGRAVRPGDILRSASGKTVEVINTDAEGRLILADGLWYARRLGATHLVDVATLTGACVVALGRTTSGLFARPDSWGAAVKRASERAGDRLWPMPLFDDYFEQLKSEMADMTNSGGRPAGAATAAVFLGQFTGDLPWAHLDVAGTAWADEARPWQAKGATGVAVRTLVELALAAGEWA